MILRLREVKFFTQGPIQEWQRPRSVLSLPHSKAQGNTAFACLLLWSQRESSTLHLIKHVHSSFSD